MRTVNITSLVHAVCLSLLALLPTHVLAASTDAAWVAGDLKVYGIHFTSDNSVQTKASPWGNGDPNNAFNIGFMQGNVGIGTLTPSAELEVVGTVKATGNLVLPNSTAITGNIMKGTIPFIHNYGLYNTFIGENSGNFTMTSGAANTASGAFALYSITSGSYNTASGFYSLYSNTIGSYNTAIGKASLISNIGGSSNTAIGGDSLYSNTGGNSNTAIGSESLFINTTGNYNTASGSNSLYSNTIGEGNTASGYKALTANTTGLHNTAIGYQALLSNSTGSHNIGIGIQAGQNVTTGDNNIHIANPGASESNTTRIGSLQTATYIAGIYGITLTAGTTVYINSSGQLGTNPSSRRFKEEITDMGDATDGLMKLRPVTFYYKPEYASGPRLLQYGLIAEEVAQVYPDLVQYNDKGEVNTVYYQFVNAMLLNEVQKQHRRLDDQQTVIDQLKAELAEIRKLIGR
jgi:hypothetical protein